MQFNLVLITNRQLLSRLVRLRSFLLLYIALIAFVY